MGEVPSEVPSEASEVIGCRIPSEVPSVPALARAYFQTRSSFPSTLTLLRSIECKYSVRHPLRHRSSLRPLACPCSAQSRAMVVITLEELVAVASSLIYMQTVSRSFRPLGATYQSRANLGDVLHVPK